MVSRPRPSPALPGFRDTTRGPFDQLSDDGRVALKFKLSRIMGARDLHASIVELALAVEEDPAVELACLVWEGVRMSWARARQEWGRVLRILPASLRQRLGFIWFVEGSETKCEPDAPRLQAVVQRLGKSGLREEVGAAPVSVGLSKGFFEVLKVLLVVWLRGTGPIATGELMSLCGFSYPTVAGTIGELARRRELRRLRNRRVELVGFPRRTWQQVVAISDDLRKPIRFVSASGRSPEPEFLLERLSKAPLGRVGVGGLIAGRRFFPEFDLKGTPRLDLTLASTGANLPQLIGRVDPSLQPTVDPSAEFSLVVHRLRRADALFETGLEVKGLPIADPVEVLLDLHELRLEQQASDLVDRLLQGRRT